MKLNALVATDDEADVHADGPEPILVQIVRPCPSNVVKQSYEAVIHVELLAAMEESQAGGVGGKIRTTAVNLPQ